MFICLVSLVLVVFMNRVVVIRVVIVIAIGIVFIKLFFFGEGVEGRVG